jgi:hypothetical protein
MDVAQGQSAGKDLKLADNFCYHLSGFVDGEGAFPVQTRKTPWTKFGFTITPEFKISQHKDNGEILEILQKALGCGKISIKSGQPNQLVLVEKSRKNLSEKIIPFFQKYPLFVKEKPFQKFVKIINGLNNKEQNTREGFERLLDLVFQKTKGSKGKRKYSREEILSNPQRLYVESQSKERLIMIKSDSSSNRSQKA